jgi:hypothetical protein
VPDDLTTGGPIDAVFASLHAAMASLSIERLQVRNPNDDNNLWFISAAGLPDDIQIDAHPGGQPPFLIEGNGEGQRLSTSDVDEAVATILSWLASPR